MEKPWSDTTVRIEGGIRWSTSGSESECVGQGGVKKKGSRETEVMRSERELKPRARMGEGGEGGRCSCPVPEQMVDRTQWDPTRGNSVPISNDSHKAVRSLSTNLPSLHSDAGRT